jgi:phosphosulfolactate synthase
MDKVLKLPDRTQKPRECGITQVLDRGLGLNSVEDMISIAGDLIDLVKLGWGTGYVTKNLQKKIELYQSNDIAVCFGGTLFEISVVQGKFEEFRDWLKHLGITHVEISNGTTNLTLEEVISYIKELKKDFVVLSEVGIKDPDIVIPPYIWVEMVKKELKAGAWKVINESREGGDVGLYFKNGEIKKGLLDEIVSQVPHEKLIFEAPRKSQQAELIKRFGPNVNLGNIAWNDVISLETLRLGLRADTLKEMLGGGVDY